MNLVEKNNENLKTSLFKMKYNTEFFDKLQYALRRDNKCQHTAK